MSKSIMQTVKVCYVCGTPYDLHKHHIFYGTANRKKSEKYGCWCYLCAKHHNMSDHAVHSDNLLDLKIKKECQATMEREGMTREDFIRTFGRSFIFD